MIPNTRTLKGQSYCSQRWANPVWPKGSKSRGFSNDRKSLENAIREAGKEGNMLDVAKYQDELNQLFNSERCQKYVKLKAIENGVKSYEEWLNETPDDEMMQDMVIGLKKEGIEELNR